MEWLQEDDTYEVDEDFPIEYEDEEDEGEQYEGGQYIDEEMQRFQQSTLGALLEDVDELQGEDDDGFIGERLSTVTMTGEELPDPDEEDLLEKVMPMEIHPHHAAVIYRYYTPEERSKREKRQNKIDKLLGPIGRPKIIKDDAYYALYESDKEEGAETPTRDHVDPSFVERNLAGLALTPEEKAFSKPKVATPLLQARILQMNPTPASAGMSLDEELRKYVAWRKAVKRQGGEQFSQDPRRGQRGQGNAIECEEEFRFKPGDIFLFLERRTETNPLTPPSVQSYINIHKDMNYFQDHGQYRLNFMDIYGPVFDGDMVVRIGNFNHYWRWSPHGIVTFYVYFNEVKPSENCCSSTPHPWYSIEQFRLPQMSKYPKMREFNSVVAENTPLGEVMPNFKPRNGDILITHIWDAQTPRFDRMKTYVWSPLLANIGVDRVVSTHDRVLRYGVIYHDIPYVDQEGQERFSEVAEIRAELYCYLKEPSKVKGTSSKYGKASTSKGNWYFMGSANESFFENLMQRKLGIGKIKATVQVPLAGDVVFDRGLRFILDPDPTKRGGPTKLWFKKLKIGGLVSFHTWEMFKSWGREVRPFVRFTDVGKYGIGNTTMALRFGTFKEAKGLPETSTWFWRDRNRVELFLLNTRGSSWRRVTVADWPDNVRPRPNYNWQPYDKFDVAEVPPWFEPKAGDVIIRLRTDHVWVSHKSNPALVGNTYNPHYDVHIEMGIWGTDVDEAETGDYLIRAGYESNEINPTWTNATVELYCHEGGKHDHKPWKFLGRDAYIFGTNYISGGLKGVEQSGFGKMSMRDIEKLNRADREKFVQVDPSELWREKTRMEALRDPQPP